MHSDSSFIRGNYLIIEVWDKFIMLFFLNYQAEVIAYDYADYGLSPNNSSEENSYLDLETVLSYVVTVLKYKLN